MPKILDELPKVSRQGRKPKYDFDALFGHGDKAVELIQGTDFDCSVTTMRHNLYRHSDKRNIQIKTVTPEGTEDRIVFQVLGEKKPKNKKATTKTTKGKATSGK